MLRVEVKHQLAEADLDAVARVVRAAARADGHHFLAGAEAPYGVGDGGRPAVTVMAWDPAQPEPVGVARVGREKWGWALEVVTDPASTSDPAVWESLITAAVDVAGQHGGGRARLWVHEAGAEHDELAAAAGLRPERDLYQMRRPLPLDEPVTIATRPFVVGQDEAAWLAVNNRAFAGHPDQGGWTAADLALLEGEPWFDPDGFLLHERDDRLVGFCWTKVHSEVEPPLGEIFVVAVDPDFQGLGLGRHLMVAGLDWLARQGLGTSLLYVDACNQSAVGLYRALGFSLHHVDRAYVGAVPPTSDPKA